MADLPKTTQTVSSSHSTENVSVCALIPSEYDVSPGETPQESILLDEGSSLQELIDSELALRVSGSLNCTDNDVDESSKSAEERLLQDSNHLDDSCMGLDVNTQLIMAERKSCFENMAVNGMHFFTVIDDEDVETEGTLPFNYDETAESYDSPSDVNLKVDFGGFDASSEVQANSPELDLDIMKENGKADTLIDIPVPCASKDIDESPSGSASENQFSPNSDEPSTVKHDINRECAPLGYDFFSPLPDDLDPTLELEFQVVAPTPGLDENIPGDVSEYLMEEQNEFHNSVNVSDGCNGRPMAEPIIDLPYETNNTVETDSVLEEALKNKEEFHDDSVVQLYVQHVTDETCVDADADNTSADIDTLNIAEDISANIDSPNIVEETSADIDTLNTVEETSGDIVEELSVDVDILNIVEETNSDVDQMNEIHSSCLQDNSENGLTTQGPLHETVNQVEVCVTNPSDVSSCSDSDLDSKEMVTSNSSEKKIIKKKKKSVEGTDTVKMKKTKKNKKTDSEKENLSVNNDITNVAPVTNQKHIYINGGTQDSFPDDLANVSVKELRSSFSKFDQLTKKTVLHVRSVDASKVQQQFNQSASSVPEVTSNCRSCSKQVFQMEQIKAEGAIWHKNCFRCKECNKQLNVDNYSSNEGVLYCKPHFKELFKPKAVPDEENEIPRVRRPKMIVCENQPVELPPEVVRASDKPDLGLEELSSLNVKSRYQMFEKTETEVNVERSPSSVSVKRSPSILSKLARFQAKGMDIGVTDDSLNNVPYEESSSSEEEEEENEDDVEKDVIRANRKQRERPMSFNKMGDIKCRWETGQAAKKEERREERKQEIQSIRSRLFMGKQGKMKEMYEQAVQESERGSQKKDIDIGSEKAKSIKEKFERGEVIPDDDEAVAKLDQHRKSKEEDLSIFEEGISKKSRSLFLELDAKTQQPPVLMSPVKSPQHKEDGKKLSLSPQVSKDIVRSTDAVEDVKVETSEVFNKFKFFEMYKEPEKEKKQFRITPPRDGQVKEGSPDNVIYRDPAVVRSEDKIDDDVVKAKTASKMLSIFRQMEERATKEEVPDGPKPLKRFTPPPDYTKDSDDSEEEEDSEDEEDEEEEEEEEDERDTNPNIIRASDKIEDEFLKQATTAARAKALRAKFERWEEKENKLNASSSGCHLDIEQSDQPSIDSTKSLRAKFESLKNEAEQPKERPQIKVNRFVEFSPSTSTPSCYICNNKVYPVEKVEADGKIFHKQCFRCQHCNCVLRMESFTFNNEKLYCLPHFKQLFIAKGNYDEGFGMDQHKRKWNIPSPENDIFKE